MVTSIKNIVEDAVVKSRKLKEGIIKGRWREVAGNISTKSQPLYIRDNTLFVLVENSTYLYHMNMNKNKYLEKIAEILKGDYVTEIRYKVSKINEDIQKNVDDMYINSNKRPEKDNFVTKIERIQSEEDIEEALKRLKLLSEERQKFLLQQGFKKCRRCGSLFEGKEDICSLCSYY
ncbi:MAG: DUF721 domain-containing protein [Cetobacterium sp.]